MRVSNCNCTSTITTTTTVGNVRVNRNIQHNITLMKMMMMKPSTSFYRCYITLQNVIKTINIFALGNA